MKSFEDIIGHDKIINDITRMLEEDKLSHAMLFDGKSGIGKKYTAKKLAKTILCEENSSSKEGYCGNCPSCRQFDNNSNPDYLFVKAEDGSIKKNQIQEVIEFLSIRPHKAKYKIVIIEDFDKATREAQNTILKTLEEPPDYGKIILLSENNKKLLDTIRSRVKLYKFFPIAKVYLVEYLIKSQGISEEEASFYADYSGGAIGKALKYIEDEDFSKNRVKVINILDNAIKGQRKYVLENIDFFTKENINQVLELYITWIRDLLIYKESKSNKFLYNKDMENIISSQMFLSVNQIESIKEKLIKLQADINYNLAPDFIMEVFFIDIMEECQWKQ